MLRIIRLAWDKLQNAVGKLPLRLDPAVTLGRGVHFCGHREVSAEGGGQITLGENLHARAPFYALAQGGRITIGPRCFFNHNCSITAMEQITIGTHCVFGNNLVIVDHDHDFRHRSGTDFLSGPVEIGNEVWVGANVTILRNTIIEDRAVIAAGSVVKGRVPAGTVYASQKISK